MTTLEKRLLSLQQQVQQLNSELSTLIALTSSSMPIINEADASKTFNQLVERKSTLTEKPGVGINRYRQLQTSEPSDRTNDHSERYLSRSGQR